MDHDLPAFDREPASHPPDGQGDVPTACRDEARPDDRVRDFRVAGAGGGGDGKIGDPGPGTAARSRISMPPGP